MGMALSANKQKMATQIDSFTNEEIMADDLEMLKLYKEVIGK